MEMVLALGLLAAFWGLLWLGAWWVAPDTRDGRDWAHRDSTDRPLDRPFD